MKTNSFATIRACWLSLVVIYLSLPLRAEQFGLFTYQVIGGSTVEITDYPESAVGPIEIPAQIDDKPVTSIGVGAFQYCSGLTNITIPEGITTIDGWPFLGCSGLTSITIPSSVTTIGVHAFQGCSGLTSVSLHQGLTSIGDSAFRECSSLTSVTIPEGVTSIGDQAFNGCASLQSILVEPGNAQYSSLGGVLLNATQTVLIRCPEGKSGGYTIPSSVTSIGHLPFEGCSSLTSVTIPSSVTAIYGKIWFDGDIKGVGAFSSCTALTAAVFLGDAPPLGGAVFENTAPGFTIYYLSSRAGFTSPTWRVPPSQLGGNGWDGGDRYPATMINEATYPAASWLLAHGLWYDTDLHQDPDGDGVSLLMAYALDLDPRHNLQGSLPEPVLDGAALSLTFHATSPGIIYKVETSTDLTTWTVAGVTQSAPAADGQSTASVVRDAPNRFLRLLVED